MPLPVHVEKELAERNDRSRLDQHLLEGDDDVRHVLGDAGDARELMVGALDADGGDGDALNRGKEDAAEGDAHRLPVAVLKGIDLVARVGGRGLRLVLLHACRHDEFFF